MKRATLVRSAVICAVLCFSTGGAGALQKYWITFTDKGPASPQAGVLTMGSPEYQVARAQVTPRALERRAKVLPAGELVTAADLPLHAAYVARIKNLGGRIAHTLRWMNAASAFLTDDQLALVRELPFVQSVSPILLLRAPKEPEGTENTPPVPKSASFNYGASLMQAQMINVPILHELGINGKGVIVGMLDSGFRWRLHEALKTRDVIGEYDFINGDNITENQSGDVSSQHNHGTLTFAVLGGYMPGKLIGPAYGSGYLFAKTEIISSETQIEEDHWAAGIEWLESLGADVVSSSVGYNIFDDNTGYFWSRGDFNGRTSVTALAALRAARLGVTLCNAMGNESNGDGFIGTMLTPADADSIISVGAVSFSRYLAGFSGTGPTNDGRTKPDVVAPGVGVYYASASGASSYGSTSGTSLATPLVAGAAALVLSARPELTPIEIRDALRATADTIDVAEYPSRPNNFTGWGIINALDAALSFGPIFSNEPVIGVLGAASVVSTKIVSRFGITPGSVVLKYAVGESTFFSSIPMTLDSAMVFPTSGRYTAEIPIHPEGTLIRFSIEARDDTGHRYESPAPVKGTAWRLHYGLPGGGTDPPLPVATELTQNYPNPFNPTTSFDYRLAEPGFVTCKIYDLLGREVATLVNKQQPAGFYTVRWNAAGESSGIYFYRLMTPSSALTGKMVLVR